MKVAVIFFVLMLFSQYNRAQDNAQKFKDSILKSPYFSQTELKGRFVKYDFSKLFTHTENSQVYGFIGENFMRIRIKIITIYKNPNSSSSYIVYGKSMVKNIIDEFNGTITVSNIRKLKGMNYGVDDSYKNKGIKGEYKILGNYQLAEKKSANHSGTFKGSFDSDFYLDKYNNVHYDDIEINADGYTNNQFVGTWTNYKNKEVKKCNWGDYRIPNSGDLDIGAGEFSPATKYLPLGWQSLRDIVVTGPNTKQAKKIEEAKWWR